MEEKTHLDMLRVELNKLLVERDKVIKEKGDAAEHNKDLRENADYDYWLHREMALTIRIRRLTAEIESLYKKRKS